MIPDDKKQLVIKGLQHAFGVNEFEDIKLLTKGLSSALIFRIMVKGKPYLLRVITRTDAIADPGLYFDSMISGAEAGLGPTVYYANVEDRISITDFVEAHPFPMAEARLKLADSIRKLHALPKFRFRINYPETMDGMAARFRASGVLPDALLKDVFEEHERVRGVYPGIDDQNWVSCHNDLKPENIIYDGSRPWLVDWEAAFLNDRYADLAVVSNFMVKHKQDEAEFLAKYFGTAASEYQHARFYLMRQMMHMYYLAMFLSLAAVGKPIDLNGMDRLDFRTFHNRMWNGKIDLKENDARLQYGLVHLQQCKENLKSERLKEAIEIVGGHQV